MDASFGSVRVSLIDLRNLAALGTNGRSLCRVAVLKMMRTRQILCCERAQHENPIHRLGSELPLAALSLKVNCREAGQTLQRSLIAQSCCLSNVP